MASRARRRLERSDVRVCRRGRPPERVAVVASKRLRMGCGYVRTSCIEWSSRGIYVLLHVQREIDMATCGALIFDGALRVTAHRWCYYYSII